MYTIGEFSAITGISKKTLRYYDEVMLLNPAQINRENGYRLYNDNQIRLATNILKYKGIGLSLSDIREVLTDSSNINRLLDLRLSTISNEIKVLKQQQNNIRDIKKSGKIKSENCINLVIKEKVLDSGNIIHMDSTINTTDLHVLITEFYNYISRNKCNVTSGHFIKRSIDDEDDESIQIFAYANKENKLTSFINQKKTLEIVCSDINQKGKAYEKLINHAKANQIIITDYIEEYKMNKGKLVTYINGVIDS